MQRPSNSHDSRPNKIALDVLSSRLGRKLISRFFLVGVIPLFLFAVPLYLQTTSILNSSARASVMGYSQLAGGDLFSVLDRGASHLERLKSSAGNSSTATSIDNISPFRRIALFDSEEMIPGWDSMPNLPRQEFLSAGKTVITTPYPVEEAMTVSLVVKNAEGKFLAGEMDPAQLWRLTRAGIYGTDDILIVLDQNGRTLASSSGDIPPGIKIMPGLPRQTQASGDSTLPLVGDVIWGFSDLWLEGAFEGERWGILITKNREALTSLPYLLLRSLFLLLALAICLIVILSFRQSREILAPVVELAAATRRVSPSELVTITATRADEIGDLASSFNEMTQRLRETYEESVRLTREAMVGRLAAMVAHQINTPLAAMRCKLELLDPQPPGIAVVQGQIDRVENIVRTLLGFAKLRTQGESNVRVVETARNVEELFRPSFTTLGINFVAEYPLDPSLDAACTSDDLQELLVNILENAKESCAALFHDSSSEMRRIPEINMKIQKVIDNNAVEIVIEDTGAGFEADLARIFDPFVTSKTSGAGLGLAICRKICETVGGSIRAENRSECSGARFIIMIPLAAAQ